MIDTTMGPHAEPSFRRINLVRIAHIYYTHKRIDEAHDFLKDFGLHEVQRKGNATYFRGSGSEPFVYCARQGDADSFGGAAFVVETEEDLEYASQTLPNATEVYDLTDAPGGGRCVTFYDPVDGFPFHLVHGQTSRDTVETFPQLDFNFVGSKEKRADGQLHRVNCIADRDTSVGIANRQEQSREQVATIRKR